MEGVGRAVVDEVMVRITEELARASEQPDLKTVTYLPFSTTHRLKIRLWQAMAILSSLLPRATAPPSLPHRPHLHAPAFEAAAPAPGGSQPALEALQTRIETLVAGIFRVMRTDERRYPLFRPFSNVSILF